MAGTSPAMTWRERAALPTEWTSRRRRTHEVALTDFDAALPDDVVGGGAVKIEVRQGIAEQRAKQRKQSRGDRKTTKA